MDRCRGVRHSVIVVRGLAGILATAIGAAVPVVSGVAHAQPGRPEAVQLDWQAPAGCPTPAAMRDRIAEVAGESARSATRVHARARQQGTSWIVELDAGDGPRSLRGRTCADVARAAALVIGMAVRRRAEAPGPPTQVADGELPRWSRSSSDDAPPQQAEVRIARAVPGRRSGGPDLAVRATVGAAAGVLPGWAGMARAGVETSWRRAALRLDAEAATLSSGLRLDTGDEVAVRETLVAAVASGCWVTRPLSWCAGLEVGQVHASAVAQVDRESRSALWTAVGAGPSLVAPLGGAVSLVLHTEASVPLVFPRFFINGQRVSEPDPVSLRAGLGLHVHIP